MDQGDGYWASGRGPFDRQYMIQNPKRRERKRTKQKMGVEKTLLRAGTGPKPTRGQNVTVHCTGFGLSLILSLLYCCFLVIGNSDYEFDFFVFSTLL